MVVAHQKRITIVSNSPGETQRLGMWVGRHLRPGDVVCLKGKMGAGKTLWVRSPTFTLVHEYMGKYPMYHLDFYRIQGEEELEGIGWEEYLYGAGITVIEAAEKMMEVRLPEDRLDIVLERDGVRRRRLTLVGLIPSGLLISRFDAIFYSLSFTQGGEKGVGEWEAWFRRGEAFQSWD
jgi:tRNA threonylcarbamoyladenosine biosynthesis protein TsaE